jgi:subfamily B ATP-binding cassette protein MsbA
LATSPDLEPAPPPTVRDPLRDIPRYLRTFRDYMGARIGWVFFFQLLSALLEGIGIVMMLPLLHALGATGDSPGRFTLAIHDFLSALGFQSPVAILLLIAGLFVIKGLVAFTAGAYLGYLRADLQRTLHERLYDAYSKMDYRYYTERDTGHFFNLFGQVYSFIGAVHSFSGFAVAVIRTVVYVGMAVVVAWTFGLAAIIVGSLVFLAFRRVNNRVRELSQENAGYAGRVAALFVQTIQSFKYLSATATAEPVRKAMRESVVKVGRIGARQNLLMAFTGAAQEPIAILMITGIVIFQIGVLGQPLAPIMVSILLFYRGVNTVLGLQGSWQSTLAMIGAVDVVRDELDRLARHVEPIGGQPIAPMQQGIEFRKVSYAYEERIGDVLTDVSFQVPARQMVAIVGASGAGKSTLVDLLTLLLTPRQGAVLIDGVPASTIERASWRRQIGYVMQEAVIFDDSFAQNICLWSGDPEADPALMARIREAARQAHLADFIESLPDSYATRVGDRGIKLSGGQRQRLFIARELYKQPRLLILDEATSSLDSEAERVIRESIDELHGKLTVVIIAHRLATVRNADRILVFDKGRLVEEGDYASLRGNPDSRFSAMVAAQAL